ncbi:MAG: hypothetical protein N2423_10430 [Novosphingobium sp.]|nr:hypothetical protein [Novosphingobium sp.]
MTSLNARSTRTGTADAVTPGVAQEKPPLAVYLTIDTEYESGFTARVGRDSREANFHRAIMGETPDGAVGLGYQLDRLDRHGLKAVFFVDPMPSLLWGVEAIADVVGPIIARGHDVQLHLHTEWLALAGPANPLGDRTGTNLKDFTLEEQCRLIDHARSVLIAAGAPPPIAFRAGNYGANDDTLRALAMLGIAYDSSHSPGFASSACAISLGSEVLHPVYHCGVIEVPIGCIEDAGGTRRHAQLTALSKRELLEMISHARSVGAASVTIVSHSFELLSLRREQVNGIVKRRFDGFLAALARMENVITATYAALPPAPESEPKEQAILPHHAMRAGMRAAEQAVANILYDERKSIGVSTAIAVALGAAAISLD